MACTSPARRSRSTRSSALVPGNVLLSPRIVKIGASPALRGQRSRPTLIRRVARYYAPGGPRPLRTGPSPGPCWPRNPRLSAPAPRFPSDNKRTASRGESSAAAPGQERSSVCRGCFDGQPAALAPARALMPVGGRASQSATSATADDHCAQRAVLAAKRIAGGDPAVSAVLVPVAPVSTAFNPAGRDALRWFRSGGMPSSTGGVPHSREAPWRSQGSAPSVGSDLLWQRYWSSFPRIAACR